MGHNSEKRVLSYGSKLIEYYLTFSDRKTLEIAVSPDGVVTVKAPLGANESSVENKIIKRARWILKQIDYFRQFKPLTPARQFINGETHLYLGKHYRLRVSQGYENSVKLTKGTLRVSCREIPNPDTVERLMRTWYLKKAILHFNDSLERCWPKFSDMGLSKPAISVKRMQKRWGSLSVNGTITLNANLIKASRVCIDYVVYHELCHLKYENHNKIFFLLLTSVMPEWESIKKRLELSMA